MLLLWRCHWLEINHLFFLKSFLFGQQLESKSCGRSSIVAILFFDRCLEEIDNIRPPGDVFCLDFCDLQKWDEKAKPFSNEDKPWWASVWVNFERWCDHYCAIN